MKERVRRFVSLSRLELTLVLVLLCTIFTACSGGTNDDFVVRIGADASIVNEKIKAKILVIDADYFTADEIDQLKLNGAQYVYAYINIGSVEEFREYYTDLESETIGDYEGWDDEKWLDNSTEESKAILNEKIGNLAEKRIDGYFVDNIDVYNQLEEDRIYDAITDYLRTMRGYNTGIIINGGDTFVKKYFKSKSSESLFDGVCQESVYVDTDVEKLANDKNSDEDREYYEEYLSEVQAMGLDTFTIEYTDDKSLAKEARKYAKENGYRCYVSNGTSLE